MIKQSTVRDLDREFSVDDDQTLLANVVAYYHRTLLDAPEALAYLQKRGFTFEVIEIFKVGLSDRTLGLKIPRTNRIDGKEVRARLEQLGILRDTGHERFRGCITFPVFDQRGIVQVYGRKFGASLRAGTRLHELLHEDKRGVFNPAALASTKTIILTEGIFDALTFWVHGHRAVTCTFGTELTEDVRAALVANKVERILIAYDRDAEGDAGAEVVASELAELGMEVLRLVFPAGQDANEFVRNVEDPAGALSRLLRHPEWLAGKPRANEAPRLVKRASSWSPTPAVSINELTTSAEGDEMIVEIEDRRWRVRGM